MAHNGEALALLLITCLVFYHFRRLSRAAFFLAYATFKLCVSLLIAACLLFTYKFTAQRDEVFAAARVIGNRVYRAYIRHTEL
jgi:hypothetical protein